MTKTEHLANYSEKNASQLTAMEPNMAYSPVPTVLKSFAVKPPPVPLVCREIKSQEFSPPMTAKATNNWPINKIKTLTDRRQRAERHRLPDLQTQFCDIQQTVMFTSNPRSK